MNEIYEYVRVKRGPRKGEPRGVILATVTDVIPQQIAIRPKIMIGWSHANTSKGDTFKKSVGIAIARTRALKGNSTGISVPHQVIKMTKRFEERALKYFKGATL